MRRDALAGVAPPRVESGDPVDSLRAVHDLFRDQPLPSRLGVGADEEHFLHRARPGVEALQPRIRRVLHLEAWRRLAAADFDAAGDDAADVRTILDDPVEDLVEPADAPVLPLDPAE